MAKTFSPNIWVILILFCLLADKRKAETGNLHLSQSEEGIGGQEGDLETDLDLIASYNSQGHEDMRGQGETDAGDIDIEVEGIIYLLYCK